MRYRMNKINDSSREILQIISLIICFILPKIVNLSEVIRSILGVEIPTIETAKYYYLMLSGNWTIGALLSLYILFNFLRKSNKDTVLNKGNIYHDHSYCWYWFCSKVLGYEKCNLILVPMYMQFKLVLNDTFKEYPLDGNMFPNEECEVEIIKETAKNNDLMDSINLILEDTYPIHSNQIPFNYANINTIIIKKISDKIGKRVYCTEFIDSVVEVIRDLPENITINIFATTNPKNTYEIIKKGISLSERSNIKQVNVFQQKSYEERCFENKPIKVL